MVLTSFPFVKLILKKGEFEDGEPWKSILAGEVAEDKDAPNPPESPGTAGDEIVESSMNAVQALTDAAETGKIEEDTEIPVNLAKLTTLQLRDIAKRKGVSVARTKADFLQIIKEKNPGENLERLKGKVLFDRVSELHISRLRSKDDLQKLLSK